MQFEPARQFNSKKPQPFLRWAGSKRKQLPILSRFWNPNFSRYVEPFMGSACLFFELQPKDALLADINIDLIRTFIAVRDHSQAVANRLAKIPLGKRTFYSLRKKSLSEMEAVDAAANFIFLNRFCFNGLYRTNEAGRFNVPYASSGTGNLPSSEELRIVAKALSACTIRQADFEETLENTEEGDMVYLDPPYAVGNRRVFRQYGPSSFGLDDLRRLASALMRLDRRGIKFVLSYAYCAEALEHFQHWSVQKYFIQRNIAGFSTNRRRAAELLISNIQEGFLN